MNLSSLSTDMRKALPRDVEKKSVIPLDHPVYPEDLYS
jgi:N-terminal acetyltransferase B complex catalytic subunit